MSLECPQTAEVPSNVSLERSFLLRLKRLLDLNKRFADESDNSMLNFIKHQIFFTYMDCRELGQKDNADLLLRQYFPPPNS